MIDHRINVGPSANRTELATTCLERMDASPPQEHLWIKPAVRARVAHVFGTQINDMGGALTRTIGLIRGKARIGMRNLCVHHARPCPAPPPQPAPAMIRVVDVRPTGPKSAMTGRNGR